MGLGRENRAALLRYLRAGSGNPGTEHAPLADPLSGSPTPAAGRDSTSTRGAIDLHMNLQQDRHMELYCDVLVLYLLVDASLGDCELQRDLSDALDSADTERLAAGLRRFHRLPDALKSTILAGASNDEAEAMNSADPAETVLSADRGAKTA